MDVIGNFIKECCIVGANSKVRIRELFKTYQDWCEDNNEHASSERLFGMRIKELGYKQGRTAEARFWEGIALKPSAAQNT
jgi:putative DNA primase/helicase